MRTKSLRIDSSVSCSTIRVPVGPPAKPVAITGWPSVFTARARLTPLPPPAARRPTVGWRGRGRTRLDRAMAAAEPEVRQGERLVDRGVEGDGDDHATGASASLWARRLWR